MPHSDSSDADDTPSLKPYLIRALHEWCSDCGYTPYLLVVINGDTSVPPAYVRNGQITLSISDEATNKLLLGDEYITFQARFGGVMENIYVPIDAIAAIYPREQPEMGMQFVIQTAEDVARANQPNNQPAPDSISDPAPASDTSAKPARKSRLRLVQ